MPAGLRGKDARHFGFIGIRYDLPKQPLENERVLGKLQEALAQAALNGRGDNVFLDTSTSASRHPEYAIDVLTCVKPSHSIYSHGLGRFVSTKEMFLAQGLFPDNCECPNVVHEMIARESDAQKLAGNAMSSTCLQAKLLSSLVHSHGWMCLQPGSEATDLPSVDPIEAGVVTGTDSDGQTSGGKATQRSSTISEYPMRSSSSQSLPPSPVKVYQQELANFHATPGTTSGTKRPAAEMSNSQCAQAQNKAVVLRRLRQKSSPAEAMRPLENIQGLEQLRAQNVQRKRKLQADCGGHQPKRRKYEMKAKVAREGKRPSITIWSKVKLFEVSCQNLFWRSEYVFHVGSCDMSPLGSLLKRLSSQCT